MSLEEEIPREQGRKKDWVPLSVRFFNLAFKKRENGHK